MRLKALHQKKLVKTKNIINDSVMNQIVPQLSSIKTPKEMFDSLTKLFEEEEARLIRREEEDGSN